MRLASKHASAMLLLLIGVLAASCASGASEGILVEDPWGTVEISRVDAIRVGIILASLGEGIERETLEQQRGAEMALADYGSIDGFSLELVPARVECSAEGGQFAAGIQAGDSSIVGIIGPNCSASCLGAVGVLEEAHYTLISPACGATSLSDQVTHRNAFLRTMSGDSREGEIAARFAYLELGARRAAIIHDGTPETVDVVAAFEAVFADQGGETVAREAITPGSGDAEPALQAAAAADADVIYAPLLPDDAVSLTFQIAAAGLEQTPLLGGRYYWSNWFLEAAGQDANQVYAVGPVLVGSAYQALAGRYAETYGESLTSTTVAYAYDAAMLLLSAIDQVAQQGPDGKLLIGRLALQRALYDTSTYAGVTGTLTCTDWGDCSVVNLAVGQVHDGQWIVVYVP
jgi:branched-chain amino acid transport system substrate-binding protein